MKHQDIDRILASDVTITPSPAFLATVMTAVQRESTALPPLAFPWLRAMPGFIAFFVAMVAAVWHGVGLLSEPAATAALNEQLQQVFAVASGFGLPWVLLALVLTAMTMALASSLVRGRGYA